MDEEGKSPTFYLFSLTKIAGGLMTKKTIKKRYRDFNRLDKDVRGYYKQKANVVIPTLPPKLSPFGNKTSPKSREIYL